GARSWSSEQQTRRIAQDMLGAARGPLDGDEGALRDAFLAARLLGHAQGFRILEAASQAHGWALDFARIAEIWRAGCIIRSALLDDIADAFRGPLPAGQLILAPGIAALLTRC